MGYLLGNVWSGGASPVTLPTALLDLIAAADENSWIQANTNDYSDAWPAADYRPLFGSSPSNPNTILNAWSGFAWDDVNFRIILWGGGHANSNCNEVYTWGATSQEWGLAFYPADVVTVTDTPVGMGIEPVDWPSTPQSSHTYDTQHYLPTIGRFVTFGGAASSSGGVFKIREAGGTTRSVGCFTLDLTHAGEGKVGGTTGSNVHRDTTASIDLDGAEAWYCRDWFLDHADPNSALDNLDSWARTDAAAAVTEENGHDVVYYAPSSGDLMRFEFVDADNYLTDILSVAGQRWTTLSSPQGGALDTGNNRFVRLINTTTPFSYWDLSTAGPTNRDVSVAAADLTGPDAEEFLSQMTDSATFSLEYDERRERLVAWQRGGRVYAIDGSTWAVTKLSDDTLATRPMTLSELTTAGTQDAGVNGKWRRSATLDVYIGVQDINAGNVWMFKPANWVDPR